MCQPTLDFPAATEVSPRSQYARPAGHPPTAISWMAADFDLNFFIDVSAVRVPASGAARHPPSAIPPAAGD